MMTHKHTFVSHFSPKRITQTEEIVPNILPASMNRIWTRTRSQVCSESRMLAEALSEIPLFFFFCLFFALRQTLGLSWQQSIHINRSQAFMMPVQLLCTANTRWGSCLPTSSLWQTSVTAACGRDTTASASSSGGRKLKKKKKLSCSSGEGEKTDPWDYFCLLFCFLAGRAELGKQRAPNCCWSFSQWWVKTLQVPHPQREPPGWSRPSSRAGNSMIHHLWHQERTIFISLCEDIKMMSCSCKFWGVLLEEHRV